jgi:hypothetical protein
MSCGSRGRWLFLALGVLAMVVAAVLAPLLPVPHTSAQPVGGAAYTGTHSGGGAVEFWVSGDGSQVHGFTAFDVPGDVCEFQSSNEFPIPLDIVDDSFGPGIAGMYEVSGSFPSEGEAQGTLRLVLDEPPCDSGVLDWTATTSGTPTPTPTPTPGCEPGLDTDGDGFDNDVECYLGTDSANPDTDADGVSDGPSDPDDGGPIVSGPDNCPLDHNPDQQNPDGDGWGDACDNCPYVPSVAQENHDDDGAGDACDPDDDNDLTPDNQEMRDGTDPFDPDDKLPRDTDDDDGDGALNWEEFWVGTDPDDNCGDDCGGARTHDAWAYDINMDCWAQSVDQLMFPANVTMPVQLGESPNKTYRARYDLNGDNWVQSVDQLMFPARVPDGMPMQCTNPP